MSQEVRRLLPVSFNAGVEVRAKPEDTGPEREMMMGVGGGGGGGRRAGAEAGPESQVQARRSGVCSLVSFSAGVQVRAKPEGTGPVERRGKQKSSVQA